MNQVRKTTLAVAALLAALALSACGSSSGDGTTTDTDDVVSGPLRLVPGAPAGYEALAGEATLERVDGGTVAALQVTGLQPRTAYVAHLHAGTCDQADPGGPHFKFNQQGSESPPNEIHLDFRSDAEGVGAARASNGKEVPVGKAGSIVLHAAEAHSEASTDSSPVSETVFVHAGSHDEDTPKPAKIACAELEGSPTPSGDADGEAPHGGSIETVVLRDGEPVGGVPTLEFSAGDRIQFRVESDVVDDVHVHGYDLLEAVPAGGGTVSFDFPADIEGIFEIELENSGTLIAELQVNP